MQLFACRTNVQTEKNTDDIFSTDSDTTSDDNEGINIDIKNTVVLQTVFVTNRNGTEIKQQKDKNSKTLGLYEYGTKLKVIEETDEWFGVQDRVTREIIKDGRKIESTGWEKVYVLKNNTGLVEEIRLTPSDLNIISYQIINNDTEHYGNGKEFNDYISVELIDKKMFNSKKKNAVNFLIIDTIESKKINGVLELKCKLDTIQYVDKTDIGESMQEFEYVGQFDWLNKYLITGSYWENSDYRIIDKTSGIETQIFCGFPHISPDKKNIICIKPDPYSMTADLGLYSIADNKIEQIVNVSYKNWMPAFEPDNIFWATDNYLYLIVNHVNAFWKPDGNLNDNYQYIRIKIL